MASHKNRRIRNNLDWTGKKAISLPSIFTDHESLDWKLNGWLLDAGSVGNLRLCALQPRLGFLLVDLSCHIFLGQKFKITWWIGLRILRISEIYNFLGGSDSSVEFLLVIIWEWKWIYFFRCFLVQEIVVHVQNML
jgi:hypothetical protein